MRYKLIALDLDGTLLNKDKIITLETEKALLDVQKAGVKVAIASGRMPLGVEKYAEQLQLKKYGGYCVCFNGGLVVNSEDVAISKQYIDKKYLKIACDIVKGTNVTVVVHRYDGLFANSNINSFTEIAPKTVGAPMTQVDDLYKLIDWDIHKILFVGELDKLEIIKESLLKKYSEQLEVCFSTPWFLEVMPKGADKGTALKTVCEKSGISISEAIACGDNFNDQSMIETAGLGVVMANGEAELKRIADYVTELDCNRDGVAEVIRKFVLS